MDAPHRERTGVTLVEAYRALGIDPATAGREPVTKRYRELVKRLHPDVRPESERARATEDLQRVNAAFAAVRASDFVPVAAAPPPPPPPSEPRSRPAGFGGPYGTAGFGRGAGFGPAGGVGPTGGFGPGFGSRGFGPNLGAGVGGVPHYGAGVPPFGGASGYAHPGYGVPGGAAAAATVSPGARAMLAFVALDAIMARSGGWFAAILGLAFVRHAARGVLHGTFLPLVLAILVWGVSTRARRLGWSLTHTVRAGAAPPVDRALGGDLRRTSAVAFGAFLVAFALIAFTFFV